MEQRFADALLRAHGRSEFVIVVVADIRGFSAFSRHNESPNIAMFIKRFYLRLMQDYFPTASFIKPTGDGLLMTFPYTEETLLPVAKDVLEACLRCLTDFPTLCKDDPMINFSVPDALGFGIARGTACCLYSGDETLDYSGYLLNLASRLNDLARPSGIVVDGSFLLTVLPESCKSLFGTQQVYVRGIAEEVPIPIFYLDNYVEIPDAALVPMRGEQWRRVIEEFNYRRLLRLPARYRVTLPLPAQSPEKLKITLIYPSNVRGLIRFAYFTSFQYKEEGAESIVVLDLDKARQTLAPAKLSLARKLQFRIEFVARSLPKT